MKDLNKLRKLAGLPLQESVIVTESVDQIPDIVSALIAAGAMRRGGIEWVHQDDDDEDVKGPDGKSGWFNDGSLAHAVEDKFDPETIRQVVRFFWMIERLKESGGHLESEDRESLKKMVPFADIPSH
jgi:hypothetical protein